jgi:hypothetical protein
MNDTVRDLNASGEVHEAGHVEERWMGGGRNALGSLFGQGPGHHGDEQEEGAIAVAE